MEIVIENPSPDISAMLPSPSTPGFASHPVHHRGYRAAYVTTTSEAPSCDYYGTLQAPRPRSRLVSPEPDFEASAPPLRRVDRSGLLEIAEPEPQRNPTRGRLTGSENPGHSGTLTRRIDRSGLLEAVPEVPDQAWKSPEKISTTERQLTGAENEKKATSPRNSRSPIDPPTQSSQRRSSETLATPEDSRNLATSPSNLHGNSSLTASISSPYLRRFPGGSPTGNVERPTPVAMSTNANSDDARTRNRNSSCASPSANKFLPIDALPARNRQSYVDLTGASYTKSSITIANDSENSREKRQQPDCLGRLSPRLRNDGTSPLTISAIPDVIEAHGSRSRVKDGKDGPEGERAEAEGCEHSAGESLEETRVSFKAPNKILHNDNIQTLRVIILSEQL